MARDPIWDDLKAIFKEKFNADRERFLAEAHRDNDGGWTIHTDYHWSRDLKGHRLDYWPSRKKFRYRGRTRRGDVMRFIENKEMAQ